jgi:peptide deformylase
MSYSIVSITQDPSTCFMRKPTQKVDFPLSAEHLALYEVLSKEVVVQEGVGLAANQLGAPYAMAAIHVPDDERLKKTRADFSQTFEGVLINPSYASLSQDQSCDWEACFSVPDLVGLVPRYTFIEVTFQTLDGLVTKVQAAGFLARVFQHEIDHLNGIAFVDRIKPENTMTIKAYRSFRQEQMTVLS